jgi:hypothetical protein
MTDKIEDIYFNGNYKIDKIKCRNYVVYLSDFKYTSSNGNEYNMIYKNKGYYGQWHVIKSLSENKLYATNNLWSGYSINNTDMNAIIIDTELTYSKLKEKYGHKNICYIDSLDYANETDINEIKLRCEESIKEQQETDFKDNNSVRHIFCGANNDMDTIEITSYPQNMDINDIVYEVYYSSRTGGDNSETFDNMQDAQKFFFKILYLIVGSMDEYLEDCIQDKNIDDLNYYLIEVNKIYLKKEILEQNYSYDLMFVNSKTLDKHIKSKYSWNTDDDDDDDVEERIYIINIKHYEILNELFNFVEYKASEN